ncbi:MAG: hypothetical protein WCK51_15615 [Armatimonadota bacterium]
MKLGVCQPAICFGAIILIAPIPTLHGPVWLVVRDWWHVWKFGLASLGGNLAGRIMFFFGWWTGGDASVVFTGERFIWPRACRRLVVFASTVRQRRHQKNGLIVLAIVAVAGLIYFGYKHLGHPGSGRGTAEKQRQEKNKEWDKVYKDFEDPAPSPGAQPPVDPTVGQSNRLKKGAEAAAEAWKDAVEEAYIDPALGMGGVTPEVGVAVEASLRDTLDQLSEAFGWGVDFGRDYGKIREVGG